jgi:hypothetical protein
MAILVLGCDSVGLRRVQLQLRTSPAQSGSIAVDSSDIQEALQILDAVVLQHGFHLAVDNTSQSEHGYIRVYTPSRPRVTVDGRVYTPTIPCRVKLTSTGIEVTFGEYGFLAANPKAERLFVDVRTAFIKRYGKKNVIDVRINNGYDISHSKSVRF